MQARIVKMMDIIIIPRAHVQQGVKESALSIVFLCVCRHEKLPDLEILTFRLVNIMYRSNLLHFKTHKRHKHFVLIVHAY